MRLLLFQQKINLEESDCAEEPAMKFLETFPPVSSWNKLHPSGSNYATMTVKISAKVEKMSRMTAKSWPNNYAVDLSEYYDYCKETNINVLGHVIDFPGDRSYVMSRTGISFYFASIKDKAHFILKFK